MPFNNSTMLVILALILSQSLFINAGESSINTSNSYLLALSNVHFETRSIGLELRCKTYEYKLRELLAGTGQADVSASAILRQTIEAESLRRLPFRNKSPVLSDLEECVEKVPKYRSSDQSEWSPQPQPQPNSLAGVRTLQKQDATIRDLQPSSKASVELCSKETLRSSNKKSATELFAILEACIQEQSRELEVLRQQLADRKPCQNDSIDIEQALRQKNLEIHELKAKVKDLEDVSDGSHIEGATKRASFEIMKDLYNQANERERRTNKKLEEAQRRIAQLEAQLRN